MAIGSLFHGLNVLTFATFNAPWHSISKYNVSLHSRWTDKIYKSFNLETTLIPDGYTLAILHCYKQYQI